MPVPGLETEFLHNTLRQYLVAAGVFVASYLILLLLRRQVLARLRDFARRAGGEYGALTGKLVDQFMGAWLPLVAFYVAIRQLDVPAAFHRSLYFLVVAVVAYRLIRVVQLACDIGVRRAMAGADGGPVSEGAVKTAIYVANIAVAFAGVLMALSNLGVNISALVAGLGIGGVAVALAAQAVLADLFSAIAIFLDRPFIVGDYISLDKDWNGTVENIGLKTTRIRALSGEMLVVPNSLLTSSKLRNFRHLERRRVAFTFSVERVADPAQLRRIKKLAEEIVVKTANATLDRVHLAGVRDRAADFEVVYFVPDADYGRYMDANEKILLGILDALKMEGIGVPPL